MSIEGQEEGAEEDGLCQEEVHKSCGRVVAAVFWHRSGLFARHS